MLDLVFMHHFGEGMIETHIAHPMFHWHKSATKKFRKALGLSKVQFLWLTFGNGY